MSIIAFFKIEQDSLLHPLKDKFEVRELTNPGAMFTHRRVMIIDLEDKAFSSMHIAAFKVFINKYLETVYED